MSEKYDLIIRNAEIHTMDRDRRVINRGSLAVKGDRIAKIGQGDLTEQDAAVQVIDADGMILLPGFIDTHIHIFQSFLKGLGADHRLIEWLNLSALPYGTVMTPRQHELAAKLACMEALKSGCTAICEFFYTNQDPELACACIEGMIYGDPQRIHPDVPGYRGRIRDAVRFHRARGESHAGSGIAEEML